MINKFHSFVCLQTFIITFDIEMFNKSALMDPVYISVPLCVLSGSNQMIQNDKDAKKIFFTDMV